MEFARKLEWCVFARTVWYGDVRYECSRKMDPSFSINSVGKDGTSSPSLRKKIVQ